MKFKVTQKIFEKFPKAKFGALLIEGIDNTKSKEEIKSLLEETAQETGKRLNKDEMEELPEIISWNKIFEKLELNTDLIPSHQALLERVLSEQSLPDINPLVNIYNIISLKHLIPIGGHDAGKVDKISIDETKGSETFQIMNKDETEKVEKGEIAYLSEDKVLTRHFVWRQSETSKTDSETTRIFVPIDDAAGRMKNDELKKIASEITRTIKKFLGGEAKFEIIDKSNNSVDFASVPETNFSDVSSLKVSKRWKKYMDMVEVKEPKMDVITDEKKVDEVLTRGVKDIFPSKEELKKVMMSGKRLRLYTGIDPTADFLHVGHFIWMRRLAKFQKLGHQVIFLIGAFTAMIGDPDKEYTREPLTKERVWENFKGYEETARKFIDFDWDKNPVTILNNYDWLSKVRLEDWLQIMGRVTMQHLLSHDMFRNRLEEEKPIRLHEISYPLMQGFDGVVMNVDLEQGGSDQTFNMLTGRILSRELISKEKFVLTNKLLTDAKGDKIGKTTGNAISTKDSPKNMYGKVMSWPDEAILPSFELLTDFDLDKIQKSLDNGKFMQQKKRLSFEIVKMVFDEDAANQAQKHFEKTVQEGEKPDDITVFDGNVFKGTEIPLVTILKKVVKKRKGDNHLPSSNSAIKRLAKQGGIKVDDRVVKDLSEKIDITNNPVFTIGKRYFLKIEHK